MGLKVPDRVHVIPVGHEVDRVLEAAMEYKADKVVLIGHDDDDETGAKCFSEVQQALEEQQISVETRRADLFGLYDSIRNIAEAITEHQNEEVYVDVSTGSKVTAIAGMIASTVTGAKAYYTKAKSYDGIPKGIEDVTELPHYPIDTPAEQEVAVMRFLLNREESGPLPTKGELIKFGEYNDLVFLQSDVSEKGKYRLLDNHIIEPLRERGYLTTEKEGRTRLIGLTEEGKKATRAFEPLVQTKSYDFDFPDNSVATP